MAVTRETEAQGGWWAEILSGLDAHDEPKPAPRATDGAEVDGDAPETPPWLRPSAWKAAPPRGATLKRRKKAPPQTPVASQGPSGVTEQPSGGAPALSAARGAPALTEEILPVLRGMERSFALARQLEGRLDEGGVDDATLQAFGMLSQGLYGLWARCRDVLGYHGLTLIDPQGEPFDARRCLPIRSRRGTGQPNGVVVEVLSRGYAVHGEVKARAEVVIAWEPPGA